jgi:hypothetical protein
MLQGSVGASNYLQLADSYMKRGLFNPRKWGNDGLAANIAFQRELKIMILRRLYPGMRSVHKVPQKDLIKFLERVSAVTGDKTSSDALSIAKDVGVFNVPPGYENQSA